MSVGEAIDLAPEAADARLAAQLFLAAPLGFGGIVLRGFGPARDGLRDALVAAASQIGPVVRIPMGIDAEQLTGGLDLAATLREGRRVTREGLIERSHGGIAVVGMAERLAPDVAAQLAQAVDRGALALILLDDGIAADEAPPPALRERCAFHCDTGALRTTDFAVAPPRTRSAPRNLTKPQRKALAATAAALGIASIRPVLFAQRCAQTHAARAGRDSAQDEDLAAATRLVLAPRATQMPHVEPPPPGEQPPQSRDGENDDASSDPDRPVDDLLLEAAAAAIPKNVLDLISGTTQRGARGISGRAGQKRKSARRGRPLGSLPGTPGDGRKLALIDTLREAAPWQPLRRGEAKDANRTLHVRKSDLRIRRFEERSESLTIFAVDASGSSALARLAEAKGAVERMLAEAHVKRAQVALIAFRQSGAELLLAPTRSLTRARRMLSALPGGGGTPLAAGLIAAQQLADAAQRRGQTPTIAVLTDGKANVPLDGEGGRAAAMADADAAARTIAAAGHNAIVIDISPRPRPEAGELAAAMHARYLPLPLAQSEAMVAAIAAVGAA